MPQMEKFGKASATTTVTSAPGSSSRARKAALMPASLPPIMTRCMTGFPFVWWLTEAGAGRTGRAGPADGAGGCSVAGHTPGGLLIPVLMVGDDDLRRLRWARRGYSARITSTASAPPTISAAMNAGTDEGA